MSAYLPDCFPRGARLRPLEAVQIWLATAGVTSGSLFRRVAKGNQISDEALTAGSVAAVVKHRAERAGLLTSAAETGATMFKMMEVSRHKSVDTLRGYVRRADLFRDHAGTGFL